MEHKCKICSEPSNWTNRCEDHKKCDDCGTKKSIVFRGNSEVTCYDCHEKRMVKKIAAFKGDHSYTNEVVCPWCGHEHRDSWEMSDGETECHDCERSFEIERQVDVTYSTSKLREPS